MNDFPYIPNTLIAQTPLRNRDECRLMVLNKKDQSVQHDVFKNLDKYFSPGDVLVLNDVKVFPARLKGRKPTGGQVKILLLRKLIEGERERWTALLTPALKPGTKILFDENMFADVLGKNTKGEYEIDFSKPISDELDKIGTMPLPPYIHRHQSNQETDSLDKEYYQTVFAKDTSQGAVAAPTAGLHFTPELLKRIEACGVTIVTVCLKVGWGTFRPIQTDDYRAHTMLSEEYEISESAAQAVNEAGANRKRVWAVGTTVVRTLEHAARGNGKVPHGRGEADLYIYPGFKFKVVDVFVTNFHLPRYTPLVLTAAFSGTDFLKKAYDMAVQEKYRFFSYGDAMLIL